MEARSPLLVPLLFFGPPSSRGLFFVQKHVLSRILVPIPPQFYVCRGADGKKDIVTV